MFSRVLFLSLLLFRWGISTTMDVEMLRDVGRSAMKELLSLLSSTEWNTLVKEGSDSEVVELSALVHRGHNRTTYRLMTKLTARLGTIVDVLHSRYQEIPLWNPIISKVIPIKINVNPSEGIGLVYQELAPRVGTYIKLPPKGTFIVENVHRSIGGTKALKAYTSVNNRFPVPQGSTPNIPIIPIFQTSGFLAEEIPDGSVSVTWIQSGDFQTGLPPKVIDIVTRANLALILESFRERVDILDSTA